MFNWLYNIYYYAPIPHDVEWRSSAANELPYESWRKWKTCDSRYDAEMLKKKQEEASSNFEWRVKFRIL